MSTVISEQTIAQALAQAVEAWPDSVAYWYKGYQWTWSQVDEAADQLAASMKEAGIGENSRVGICAPNSFTYLVTFFAIQKLGAVAVLLNRDDRGEELEDCLQKAQVELLCYNSAYRQSGVRELVPEYRMGQVGKLRAVMDIATSSPNRFQVVPLEGEASEHSSSSGRDRLQALLHAKEVKAGCQADACILFTSGSTSQPKGVRLSHQALLTTARLSAQHYHLDSSDRLCLALPLFHCFGIVFCVLSALCTNTPVYIVPTLRTRDIVHTIETNRCTVFHAVPTLYLAVVRTALENEADLSSLRTSVLAGAAISPQHFRTLSQQLPDVHFMTSYGLTESSPTLTFTDYEDTEEHLFNTVGKPLDHVEVQVAHCVPGGRGDSSDLCLPGQVGEIIARGPTIMNGYTGIARSAQPIDHDGWLHTEDMGYFDEDGYLHLTGRMKDIIIRGGENISPLEVEQAIISFGSVDLCKVFGIPHEFYGEEVVACIKLANASQFSETELRSYLAERLADYKIPARFYLFDRFPLNPAGKPDVQALKAEILRAQR